MHRKQPEKPLNKTHRCRRRTNVTHKPAAAWAAGPRFRCARPARPGLPVLGIGNECHKTYTGTCHSIGPKAGVDCLFVTQLPMVDIVTGSEISHISRKRPFRITTLISLTALTFSAISL